jgi:hypothetical protein
MADDYKSTLRLYPVCVPLRRDEYDRIEEFRRQHGVSRAEALRRQCREFFEDVEVKPGRREGFSPRRIIA